MKCAVCDSETCHILEESGKYPNWPEWKMRLAYGAAGYFKDGRDVRIRGVEAFVGENDWYLVGTYNTGMLQHSAYIAEKLFKVNLIRERDIFDYINKWYEPNTRETVRKLFSEAKPAIFSPRHGSSFYYLRDLIKGWPKRPYKRNCIICKKRFSGYHDFWEQQGIWLPVDVCSMECKKIKYRREYRACLKQKRELKLLRQGKKQLKAIRKLLKNPQEVLKLQMQESRPGTTSRD